MQFVSGQRVVEVFADLHTFIAERRRPAGEVETFAAASVDADVPRVREQMQSDDAAGLLLRFDGGARGVCTISQVSAGRRNRLAWEIDGDDVGPRLGRRRPRPPVDRHRGRPNEIVEKDPALLTPEGAAATAFPGGHVEGYPDTFRALLTAVYPTSPMAGRPSEPTYPTFAEGHDIMAVCDADHGLGQQRVLGEGRSTMRSTRGGNR